MSRVSTTRDPKMPMPAVRFCALEYLGSDCTPPGMDKSKIIALVTLSEKDGMEIRVHPEWETIVQPVDREYLGSLYRDFRERIQSDPEALFRQLSNLAVGPVVTCVSGSNLVDHPVYLDLMNTFCAL
jgi:hypothetical protein